MTDPDTTFTYAIGALTFTAANWDTPQSVAVTGVSEYSYHDSQIDHAVSGADYGGVSAATVEIRVTAASTTTAATFALSHSITDADTDAAGVQVGEDAGPLTFTVNLTGTTTAEATVVWSVAGVDPATDLTGYPAAAADRTLTFTVAEVGAGTAETFTVTVADDSVHEALETLIVQLADPTSAADPADTLAIGAGTAQVQILDDDPAPVVAPTTLTVARGTPASGSINEGMSQSFTVTAGGNIPAEGLRVRGSSASTKTP